MTPGTIEFRKHIQKKFPKRSYEPVSEWLKRLNRELGLSPTSRMSKLYYDQTSDNARFSIEEYSTFFNTAYPSHDPMANLPIHDLLLKFEQQQQSLEKLEQKIAREWEFKQKLATLLVESGAL